MFVVNASLPIATLFVPVTAASKALSPRTVLPDLEFAPLPILTLLKVESDPAVMAAMPVMFVELSPAIFPFAVIS